MTVQPHEPVRSWLTCFDDALDASDIAKDPVHEKWKCPFVINKSDFSLRVTLANGQRIIVKALSEEKKAARRKAKMIAAASESYLRANR